MNAEPTMVAEAVVEADTADGSKIVNGLKYVAGPFEFNRRERRAKAAQIAKQLKRGPKFTPKGTKPKRQQ